MFAQNRINTYPHSNETSSNGKTTNLPKGKHKETTKANKRLMLGSTWRQPEACIPLTEGRGHLSSPLYSRSWATKRLSNRRQYLRFTPCCATTLDGAVDHTTRFQPRPARAHNTRQVWPLGPSHEPASAAHTVPAAIVAPGAPPGGAIDGHCAHP